MKLRICSDLHLESSPEYRLPVVEGESDCVLILAGDVCELRRQKVYLDFMEDVSARFKHVIHVPGNHEYYRGHIPISFNKSLDLIKHIENVSLVNDQVVKIEDVVFIVSTLWTDLNKADPLAIFYVQQGMNDYHCIRVGNYQKLRAVNTLAFHKNSKEFIVNSLKEFAHSKCVVVSHHSPSSLSIHRKYSGDPLNAGYHSDLSEIMLEHSPKLWIHGHTHDSFDYNIGDTRIVCNPKGYPLPRYLNESGFENRNYNAELVVEV